MPASLPRQLRELLASCLDLEPSARPKASVLATSLRDIMLLMLAQASRGPGGGAGLLLCCAECCAVQHVCMLHEAASMSTLAVWSLRDAGLVP